MFNVSLNTLLVISGTIFTGQMTKQQRKSTEENQLLIEIRLESHQNHSTMLQYTTLGNRLYAWIEVPSVTNPICWKCKNCSHKYAADCEHCVTQSSTEQSDNIHS